MRVRRDLASDCSRCVGLCCVALPFRRSADFSVDKAAGEPCRNLLADHSCGIHDRLRDGGWVGCTVYECFGAGQAVTAAVPTGWRDDPSSAARMFAVFPVVQQAHEVLRHLAEAERRADDDALRTRAAELAAGLGADVDALLGRAAAQALPPAEGAREEGPRGAAVPGSATPEGTVAVDAVPDPRPLDLAAWRARVGPLLVEVSAAVRSSVALPPDGAATPDGRAVAPGRSRGGRARPLRVGPRADLAGAALADAVLCAADLRGALLLGADLRGADLRWADLLGADLRGADLAGADLREALYLTQPQVDAARGDGRTLLGEDLRRPRHWRR